jgi:hypothetical protein
VQSHRVRSVVLISLLKPLSTYSYYTLLLLQNVRSAISDKIKRNVISIRYLWLKMAHRDSGSIDITFTNCWIFSVNMSLPICLKHEDHCYFPHIYSKSRYIHEFSRAFCFSILYTNESSVRFQFRHFTFEPIHNYFLYLFLVQQCNSFGGKNQTDSI